MPPTNKEFKEKLVRYDWYSRTNQQLLDGAIVAMSFYLAFLIRFDGAIPAYHQYQFWVYLLPVVLGQLLTNYVLGLHRVQWRYIGLHDALFTARAYIAFSGLLLLIRFVLPPRFGIIRIPASVITIALMLSLLGALGIRLFRRYVYERQTIRANRLPAQTARRVLLIGAGMKGASVAKEMATNPTTQVVGFLDDDPRKIGTMIAGAKVLGPCSSLAHFVRTKEVDDVLVCISEGSRGPFNRLVAVLAALPVTSKFVPTISEILDSHEGLHLTVGQNGGNGQPAKVTPPEAPQSERQSEIRNKKILITGGGGFIGSRLAERLALHNEVVLLDRIFQDQPAAFTTLHKNSNVRMIEADILESPVVEEACREAEIVIHAAAIVGVGRVCSYPRETLETNFGGTSRVLKALERSTRLERFIYFSTSEVFGANSFRVHEDSPSAVGSAAEARWSYAIAKLAGEHLVKAYHRQDRTPVVIVRPFNVFGPRRLGAHAILSFSLSALLGNPIEVHGDGSQIRSWCFIEDFCDALVAMISNPQAVGEDFNIGNPENTLTIYRLAQEIVTLSGRSVPIVLTPSPFPDIEIRVPSLDKARKILNYRPSCDLNRGLATTVDWYREHLHYFEKRISRAAVSA